MEVLLHVLGIMTAVTTTRRGTFIQRDDTLHLYTEYEVVNDVHLQCSSAANQKASSENRTVSSEEAEVFLQRMLPLCIRT